MLKWLVTLLVVLAILSVFMPRERRAGFIGGSIVLSLLVWALGRLI